jgi:hypothetical protein
MLQVQTAVYDDTWSRRETLSVVERPRGCLAKNHGGMQESRLPTGLGQPQ